MAKDKSLTDTIMEGIRQEVEDLVNRMEPGLDTLDKTEEKCRQFTKSCGRVAFELVIERCLKAHHRGYVGRQVELPTGNPAYFERYERRWVLTHLGRFPIERAYYWSPQDKQGRIPLDEAWDLDDREPSPSLRRSIGMVGAEIPFARGSRLMFQVGLVSLPEKRIQESSEALGARIKEENQAAVAEALPLLCDPNVEFPDVSESDREGTLYMQMDGGRLNTTTDGWKEPKVGTLFWSDDNVKVSKHRHSILQKEYVAVLGDADELADRLWEAACRWQHWKAERVVVLGDGAPWIWNRAQQLFPEAIQILDLYHAAEHIWEVARQLYGGVGKQKDKGAGSSSKQSSKDLKTGQWARERIEELKNGDIDAVLENLRQRRPKRAAAKESVEQLIRYLVENRCRMKYNEYQAQGLTIGSGAIESGIKNVVNQRMKGCGMRWAVQRAENMLNLRAAHLSDIGTGHELLAA